MERDPRRNLCRVLQRISTHTLTWSVTYLDNAYRLTLTISTHTLTWSVTKIVSDEIGNQEISTHTLTWSVTMSISHRKHPTQNFNSHAHVERDWGYLPKIFSRKISTHTLTWSVTSSIVATLYICGISTHTLTWSVTGVSLDYLCGNEFQLTRSRGA